MDEVGKSANLERRGAAYRCRMRCPQHLLRAGVSREKSVSLQTKERSVALERLPAARLQLMEYFQRGPVERPSPSSGIVPTLQRARLPDHPSLPFLTVGEAESLAKDFFCTAYAELDVGTADFVDMSLYEREQWARELAHRIASLDDAAPDEEGYALSAAISILRKVGRRAPFASEPSRLLRDYLRRALMQLWRIELNRAGGDYRDQITDQMFALAVNGLSGGAVTVVGGGPQVGATIALCADRFRAEVLELRSVTPKTELKHRALLQLVVDFFGRDTPIATLQRADCTRFRDMLAKLPPNFGKLAPGKSLDVIASLHAGRTLARETQSAYLKMLEQLLGWAVSERLVPDNVAAGLSPLKRREAAEEQRLPFTSDELTRIFTAPLYTGCMDDERRFNKVGANVVKRSRYWLPLIALFMGMRMEEILQLTPSHVRKSPNGTPFLVLTRDMKLKTESAEREIPVHPQLVRIGFLTWIEERRRAGCGRLFDDVLPSKHGYHSDLFTKRFATFLRTIKLEEGRRQKLCFHSFRHTFKDALNESGVPKAEAEEIGGWSRGKRTSRRYGKGLSADRLAPFVDRVTYDVDFTHLE